MLAEDQAAALRLGERGGQRLVRRLLAAGTVDEVRLAAALGRLYEVPVLDPSSLAAAVTAMLPAPLAVRYEVLAVRGDAEGLFLAMADPTDLEAFDAASAIARQRFRPAVAPRGALLEAIRAAYAAPADGGAPPSRPGASPPPAGLDAILAESRDAAIELVTGGDEPDATGEAIDLQEAVDQPLIVRVVNHVLADAVHLGASDVHWEPTDRGLAIRYRVDGLLRDAALVPRAQGPAVISRIKILAALDIAEHRLPQDGRFSVRVGGRRIDVRVSVLPSIRGAKAVLRLLDPSALALDLEALGFDAAEAGLLRAAIRAPHGIVLVTGPTGSGKTTTLYALLRELATPRVNVVTVEDPVEYRLPGVTQVQIDEAAGLTFPAVLRAVLRQDPDVIMVGEVRDRETAEIAVRAALTGHLVLSTLHTNDAPSTVARLLDMGLAPYLLAATLRLVLAQRLVRRVCQGCAEPDRPDPGLLDAWGVTPASGAAMRRGRGCPACGRTGVRGRTTVAELMPITPALAALVQAAAPLDALRDAARTAGMRTLREAVLAKALTGTTPAEEVLRLSASTDHAGAGA